MKKTCQFILALLIVSFASNSNAKGYRALMKKAGNYYFVNDLKNSELYYNKALSKKPDAYLVYYYIAYIYRDRTNFDTALMLVNHSISIRDNYKNSYYLRAHIYHELGKEMEAIADIDYYLSNNYIDYGLLALRAECNFNSNNDSLALIDYLDVLNMYKYEKWADFCEPCYNMKTAQCYTALDDYDNALKYFDIAINAHGCDMIFKCNSLKYKARLFKVENEDLKSREYFVEAINCIKSANNKALDTLELPIINAYLGNEVDALALINKLIEHDKGNNLKLASDYYYLARIYSVLNKNELSLNYLQLSLDLDPKYIKSMENDLDLVNVKKTSEFNNLLQQYRK